MGYEAIILIILIFVSSFTGTFDINGFSSSDLTTLYLRYIDQTLVLTIGTNEINNIINSSEKGNITQRLNFIADSITNNYSDGYWDPILYLDFGKYRVSFRGQIYISPPYDDTNREIAVDPNWLIYEKSGACRELAVLFNNITQRSGFNSRIVRTGDGSSTGDGATHWWNEIEINGVNKTFDVQCYGLMKYKNNCPSWMGNRSNFSENGGFDPEKLCKTGGVWITDIYGHKIEDISSHYLVPSFC
jgi:hypothetical protein